MNITWSAPYPVKPKGRGNFKPIDVETAEGDVPSDRFHLYQTREAAKKLPTMWILYDEMTETQRPLYGKGWAGAREAAEKRIGEVLGEEQ